MTDGALETEASAEARTAGIRCIREASGWAGHDETRALFNARETMCACVASMYMLEYLPARSVGQGILQVGE